MARAFNVILLLFAVISFSYSIQPARLDAQPVQVAEIISTTGEVKLLPAASRDWISAQVGMKVKEGDIIKTMDSSSAELAFGEGLNNILNIFANSQLVISRLEPGLVKLEEGRVFSLIQKISRGSTFEVRTPTAVAGARGTGWGVSHNGGQSDISGFERSVYVAGLGSSGELLGRADMNAGSKTSVLQGSGPGAFLPLTDNEKYEWIRWKEGALRGLRGYKGSGGREDKTDKLQEKLERRVKILERVEEQQDRRQENRENRKTESGGDTGGKFIQGGGS